MTNEEKKRLDNIAQLQSKVELNQNKGREKEEYENLIKKQNEFNNILSYEKIYVFSYIHCLLNI